jgi:hypothetical protein
VLAGAGDDPLDALRALCAAHWEVADGGPVHVTAEGDHATAALHRLSLDAVPKPDGAATVA